MLSCQPAIAHSRIAARHPACYNTVGRQEATELKDRTAPVNLIAVITTVGSVEDARKLATALVERQLAACAQISQIESVYRWKGAIQHEPEFRVLFKTTAARYQDVEEAIRALHPYELPAIHAFAIEHVYAPYGAWVEENSSAT
jgi:periplasmic divalent cation tolerance protein